MKNNKTLSKLNSYIAGNRKYLILVIISALLANIFMLVAPYISGRAIDFIKGENNVDFPMVAKFIGILFAVYVLNALFTWGMTVFTNALSNHSIEKMRKDAFGKISKLPLKFFDGHSHGDIISRLTNDIDAVSEGLLQGITQLFSGIVTVVGSLVLMFLLDWRITLCVIVITIICIFVSKAIATNSGKMFRLQAQTIGELNGYVSETVGNLKVVKAFGYEDKSSEVFGEINACLYDCGQKAQFYSSLVNPTTRYINNLAYISVGVLGGLVLELGHTAELAEHGVAVQYPAQLGVGRHVGLDEQHVFLRVQAAGNVGRHLGQGMPPQLSGHLPHCDGVHVCQHVVAVIFVSQSRPVLDGPQIGTQGQVAGGLDAAQDSFFLYFVFHFVSTSNTQAARHLCRMAAGFPYIEITIILYHTTLFCAIFDCAPRRCVLQYPHNRSCSAKRRDGTCSPKSESCAPEMTSSRRSCLFWTGAPSAGRPCSRSTRDGSPAFLPPLCTVVSARSMRPSLPRSSLTAAGWKPSSMRAQQEASTHPSPSLIPSSAQRPPITM